MRNSGLIALLVLSLLAAPALADDPPAGAPITPNAQGLSDAELDRRIEWLEQTLDAGAGYSKLWQYGWSSGYAVGMVAGAVRAGTENKKNNKKKHEVRTNAIVTASKALIGTTRLLLTPHPGRLGAQPMRDVVGTNHDAKLQRLAAGEAQLEEVAERAEKRHRWQRHAGNVALNLIGGGFIFGFGDDTDAAISIGVGLAVGELMIWTSPKRAEADLQSYRQQFASTPQDPPWTVSLVPMTGGAGIKIDF